MPRCSQVVTRGSYHGSAPGRCTRLTVEGTRYCELHMTKRKPTDDDELGIASAGELGIVRRWSCGCAEVRDGRRTYEQPDMFCSGDEAHGHKACVVQGKAMGEQGSLFPKEGEDDS